MTDLNPSVHIERTERTNPMTDHLTDARTCVTFASKAHVAADAISWLTKTCKQLIAHLEAQQDSPQPRQRPERANTLTDPKLHELLNQAQFGDRLALAHSNGKHTASISGPVLTDQTHDPAVGIHLLDGDPHVVRNSTGVVWAPIVQATLYRGGEIVAAWDAAIPSAPKEQAPPQPAAAQPDAQQDDGEPWSPDTEDVEFCFDYLEAQNISREVTSADLTASQGETGHEDQYETDFNRWLDSLSPGQREQITRDIEAARDRIRAEAVRHPIHGDR